MGENTKIAWADHTFNPWIGCSHVSKGCMNCYAERDFDHRYHKIEWGPRGTRVQTSEANWRKPFKWNKHAQDNGKAELVFCASLADVFEVHRDIGITTSLWRERLFDMMVKTPWLIWLVLTKRPENVMGMVPLSWYDGNRWPANVWVGFSAEDQSNFDFRIENALKIPTPVRWVSVEPMLGYIDMSLYLETPEINWVIVGGESGPNARPMHTSWVKNIEWDCGVGRVPFFFKQWGEYIQVDRPDSTGRVLNDGQGRNQIYISRVGRSKAGRLLNGKEYLEFPTTVIEEYELNLGIEEAKAAAIRIEKE